MARNRTMSFQNAPQNGGAPALPARPEPDGGPATVQWPAPGQPGASPARIAWAYARHELLYICWAMMDVALIAPLALAFMFWTRAWPLAALIAWLFLILLIPFNLSRLMSIMRVEIARQRNIILLSFVLTLLVAMRSLLYQTQSPFDLSWLGALAGRIVAQPGELWRREVALFVLLAFLWARGLTLTARQVALNDVGFRLRLGGFLFVPIIIALGIVPGAGSALPFIMLFFLSALVAVAVSRAEEVAQQEAATAYPMSPRWVATVVLTSLFVVCSAALAALAVSGQGLDLLAQWLAPLWNAFAFGSMVVVTTATYLLFFFLAPLQALVRNVARLLSAMGFRGLPEIPEFAPGAADATIDQFLLELGDPQSSLFLWFNRSAISLLVLLGLLVLFLALRRYFLRRELSFEMAESGMPATELEGDEKGLAQRILGRFERWRRWRAAATVRQLYRSMCLEAADRGFPREISETPFEYLPTLSEVWPQEIEDVHLITDAYVRVRYGEVPESDDELQALRNAWRRLAKSVAAEDPSPTVSDRRRSAH